MFKRGGGVWWTCIRYKSKKIQKSLETTDKKLAQTIEAKIRVELAEGKYFDKQKGEYKTFCNLSDKYMRECTPKKSLRSQERDKGIFKNHLVPFFGKSQINDITPKHISVYKLKRKKQGVISDTINKELGLMKASFNVAIREWEWSSSNPVNKIKMEKVSKGRVRFLSDGEFDTLYAACEEWLKPLVVCARYTGLRQGNLLSLEWKQVNMFRKTIIIEETKNGEALGLPICNSLLKVFVRLQKIRHIHSSLVFHDPDGTQINKMRVTRAFKRACKKVGVSDFRWHDIRHQFASQLVQRGVDLFRVQKLLGHKDGRITQRYAHLSPENLQSAVNVLDNPDYNLTTIEDAKQREIL